MTFVFQLRCRICLCLIHFCSSLIVDTKYSSFCYTYKAITKMLRIVFIVQRKEELLILLYYFFTFIIFLSMYLTIFKKFAMFFFLFVLLLLTFEFKITQTKYMVFFQGLFYFAPAFTFSIILPCFQLFAENIFIQKQFCTPL